MESTLRLRDILLILMVLGGLFSFGLSGRPLSAPDEGRYVEIPREMVVSGDYVTPRLYGLKYFEKPPLLYWIEAGLIKTFGTPEWAMRLMPALFGLLGCVFVYVAATKLFSRRTGLLSAFILGTTFLYFGLSHVIILDMGASVLLSGAMWSFLLGVTTPAGLTRRLWAYGVALFLGLAVLAKGIMALAIFGSVVVIWSLINKNYHCLLPLYWPTASIIFLSVALPWHLLVSWRNPGFLTFYFIQEHVLRYLTNTHHRYHPWWFFIPVLALGFMPWTAFLPQAIKQAWNRSPKTLFLLIWVLFVFVFYSLGISKLIPYILPLFPPLAVLVALFLERAFKERSRLKTPVMVYSVWSLAVIGLYFVFRHRIPVQDAVALASYLQALLVTFGIGALLVPLVYAWGGKWTSLVVIFGVTAAQFIILMQGSSSMTYVSSKGAAEAILSHMPPETLVVAYKRQYHDLSPYLGRLVKVVGEGGELAFGHEKEPELEVILTPQRFQELWAGQAPVCAVLRRENWTDFLTFEVLLDHPYAGVVCNQKRPS